MSNVPKLRFKEFSGEWEEKTIGDVSKIFGRIGYRGYTVEDIVQKGEGAIALSPGNFVNNRLRTENSTYISWFKYEESPEIMIENGDILFVKTGSTYGKTAFVTKLDEKATINPQIVVLKEINMSNTLLSYIVSNTNIKKQVEKIVVGGAIPTMSQKELAKMKFYLPSTQEQEKIASFLTSVDTKIEQLTKKEELLKQYKKGVMQQIFSGDIRFKADDGSEFEDWEEKKLGDVGKIYQPKTISQTDLTEDGYDVYGANGIIGKYSEYNHENEQIAVTCRGNTCGTVNFTKAKSWITGNAMVINLDYSTNAIKSFLYYQLSFADLTYLITGSGQPQITGDIKNHKIELPCLEEQTKIANFLSSIDSKIEQVHKQLDSTKEFKKALLQRMFV